MQPERHSSCFLDVKPLQLTENPWPGDTLLKKLNQLYQIAALVPWVIQFTIALDDPKCRSQALDLTSASTSVQQGKWTKGLLVHVRPTECDLC